MKNKSEYGWDDVSELPSKQFTCSHCGNNICSNLGYKRMVNTGGEYEYFEDSDYIYICYKCKKPTYFDSEDKQIPGPLYGDDVEYLSDSVKEVYDEARKCFSVNAYTSAVLCCRKLLMNCAVEVGADEGLSFITYINYLDDNDYIPSKIKDCVDKIRQLGNDGTHKIESRSKNDAELAIEFTSIVLKVMFEMSGKLDKFRNK